MTPRKPAFIDFFAGSGGVTQGVRHACVPVGSNDICPKKAAMDTANTPKFKLAKTPGYANFSPWPQH